MTWYRFHLELSNCSDVDWKKLVKSVNSSDNEAIQRNENSSPRSNDANRETRHHHRNIIERLEMKYGVLGGGSDEEELPPPRSGRRKSNPNDEYEDDDFIDDSALQEVAEGEDVTRRTETKTKGFFVTDRKLDTTTSNAPDTEVKRIVVRRRARRRPHPITPPPQSDVDCKRAKTAKPVCAEAFAAPEFEEEWCPDAETVHVIEAFQEVYEDHTKDVTVHEKAQAMPDELLTQLSSMDRSVHKKIPLSHKSKGYYQALADFIPLSVDELHFLISSLYKEGVVNDHVSKWTKKVGAAKLSDVGEKATGVATGAAGWIMPMDLREDLLELYDIIQDWVDAKNLVLKGLKPGSQLLNVNRERQRILIELENVIPEELGLDAKALKKNVELERRRQRQRQKALKRKTAEDSAEINGGAVSEVDTTKIDSSQGNNQLEPAAAADTSGGKGNDKCQSRKMAHDENQDKNCHGDGMLPPKMARISTEFILPPQGFNPLDFVLRERRDKTRDAAH